MADSPITEYQLQQRLLLPDFLYAVPEVELNLYFANVFLCINPANYVFDIDCEKGKNECKRWSFIPSGKDVGEFPLTLTVYDDSRVVAQGKTMIRVAPDKAGVGEKASILLIGDSLTDQTHYVTRLHALLNRPDNPLVTMIGSHAGGGKPPVPGGVAHEGYGGFSWYAFWAVDESPDANFLPYRKSHFLRKPRELDIPEYLNQFNGGKTPDYITFQLGVNDVFMQNDSNIEKALENIGKHMDILIAAFRKTAPDAVIGIGLSTLGASQDAFGSSYQCGQTAWQYKKNVFRLNRFYLDKIRNRNDPQLVIIPTVVNLDCENNFPAQEVPVNNGNEKRVLRQSNGVHPAVEGYNQMGDTFYAWLKWQFAREKSGGCSSQKIMND